MSLETEFGADYPSLLRYLGHEPNETDEFDRGFLLGVRWEQWKRERDEAFAIAEEEYELERERRETDW